MKPNFQDNEPQHEAAQTPAPEPRVLRPLRIGLTPGDPNGVGYEVIVKTFAALEMLELCTPVLFGSSRTLGTHRKTLGEQTPSWNVVASAEEAVQGQLNLVEATSADVAVDFGAVSAEAGHAAFECLEVATDALRAGHIDALVTAPISKQSIQSADFRFPGHTEYLADRLAPAAAAPAAPLMVLCNDVMRVALVTTHLPLSKIAAAITTAAVEQKIEQLHSALLADFGVTAPRIAVLGLNPHNGDGGTIGSEETDVIRPAIDAAVEKGIQAYGPYPADGFFGAGQYAAFDAVLAMYHDQGLAAFKALTMDSGVNFTAGLPFVRTSPDHGTAFDIAGTDSASPASLRAAVFAAIDIVRHRRAYVEAHANPLPKLFHERREDGGHPRREIRVRSTEPRRPE